MTQLEWFRLLAPAYSALTDEQVTALLTASALFVNVSCLDDDRANAATALYAAHLQWVGQASAGNGGIVGNIKSEREGDLSRTYGNLNGDDTWIGQSPYGLQYMDIVKVCSGAGIMTRFGSNPPGLPIDGMTGFVSGYGLLP